MGVLDWIIIRAGRAKKYNSRLYFDHITTCHIPAVQFDIYWWILLERAGYSALNDGSIVVAIIEIAIHFF